MKGKIEKYGNLYIERGDKMKSQDGRKQSEPLQD